MSFTEIIAVVFSLACIWLAVKKHVLNWPVGIIGVSAYLVLFYHERLYADMALQVVFIAQGFYGWYNWAGTNQVSDRDVSLLNGFQRIIYSILIIGISIAWALLLKIFTNASTPYVDAFAATLSLIANWLMARKRIENWILWIIADLVYISLFWYKHLYLSSGIYVVFLGLSVKGLIDWNKAKNTGKALL